MPGVYRVRAVDQDNLMYIGQTGRALKKRFSELRRHTLVHDECPWNDPHTAAQSLWVWNKEKQYTYEFSAASIDPNQTNLKGMESYLLYRYRQEVGESTLCNFGRFHPRYNRSPNQKKGFGIRGGRRKDTEPDNPASGKSWPPLPPEGKPGDRNWMGLMWSEPENLILDNIQKVPNDSGLYFLIDSPSSQIIYIGESDDCQKRLRQHRRKAWGDRRVQFSYHCIPQLVLPHNFHELENDLIGNYFENYRKSPEFQFGKGWRE